MHPQAATACAKCIAAVQAAGPGQLVPLCADCMPATPTEPPRLAVAFDAVTDVLTVEGLRFTGSTLRAMARKPHGTTLKLVKWPDGSVTMSTPSTRRRSR